MNDQPSKQVVMQRIRNRIIEHLSLVSSYAEQKKYQAQVPYVNVPTEIFCGWEDYVADGWKENFSPPEFTVEELAAVGQFDETLNEVLEALPDKLPALEVLLNTQPWERLRVAAQEALAVFDRRGKLSEDREIS